MNARTKLIGTIALGAALLVPVAHAERPDDQPGLRGPGGIAALQTAASNHPDNRAESRGPGAYSSPALSPVSHPDNRAGARGPGAREPTVVLTSTSSGFDWSDALIGGVGGMGAALLLTGFLFLFLSQRNRARVA
jgi:hypothetical protein